MDNQGEVKDSRICLSTGSFTIEELETILSFIPAEISFIDKDEKVRFFNNKSERFFSRPQVAIGKDMRLCHPKRVLPMVEQILKDFREGTHTHARFWRESFKGCFICIDYYAVKNDKGEYLGILETVQDITDLKKLEGTRDELIYSDND